MVPRGCTFAQIIRLTINPNSKKRLLREKSLLINSATRIRMARKNPKVAIVSICVPEVKLRKCASPDGVPLIAELQRLRSRYRAGSSQVEVPRVGDSHGDVALALAAACWEHDRHGFSTGPAHIAVPTGRIVTPDRPSLEDLGILEWDPHR